MNTKTRFLVGALFLIVVVGTAGSAKAVSFSLASSSASGFLADDVLNPGVVAVVAIAGVVPPPPPVPILNVDGMSYGHFGAVSTTLPFFSVAPFATGVAGSAVFFEAGFGEAPADLYGSTIGSGTNFQFFDGDGFVVTPLTPGSPAPTMGLIEPFGGPAGDNVDALDLRTSAPGTSLFWSVDVPTVTAGGAYFGLGLSAADIYLGAPVAGYAGPPPGVYAAAGALGLLPGDDLDALVVVEDGLPGFTAGDTIYFSLDGPSPSLGVLPLLGASSADILVTTLLGGPAVFAPAATIGLVPVFDDLNALDFVPEPSAFVLAAFGLAGLIAWGWRRRKR